MHPLSKSLIAALAICSATGMAAEPSLHEFIDQAISANLDEQASVADDAEFFRRIHLDLIGCIPSASETERFLNDTTEEKRTTAIDRLLASPAYAKHMSRVFDLMLMERRGTSPEWAVFLQHCFEQNLPWDEMTRQILNPQREPEKLRGAAFFMTRRLTKVGQQTTDYAGLTRDVGRMFMGVDLQCAQCHDHLFIDDYRQRDFQGLFGVYQNVSIRKESFPAINERTMTEPLDFISVLSADEGRTGPRIPFGREYDVPSAPEQPEGQKKRKPDPNDPPSFSAAALIAKELPRETNQLFCQNIVNRIWFILMGRGLVEPIDQFHSDNPATHPDLLERLANEFANHDFDLRWLIRELTQSRTYQRSSQTMTAGSKLEQEYQCGLQRPLTAEQLFASTIQATGNAKFMWVTNDAGSNEAELSEEGQALQKEFVSAFAGAAKETPFVYRPSVKQALFLLNSESYRSLLEPREGNLTHRLLKMNDQEVTDELYLNIFARRATDTERAMITDQLKRTERKLALEQLVWAMLTSMEFSVNH